MALLERESKSERGAPFDGGTVTLEQIAAAIARLEVKVDYLTDKASDIEKRLDGLAERVSITERLTEKAQGAWWAVTKTLGGVGVSIGFLAWALEHAPKLFMAVR